MKLPWIKFEVLEWMRDTRPLSLASKGAWMDIICALHGSQNRGTLTLPVVGWARLLGASIDQVEAVIAELSNMQTANIAREANGDVTVSCRRMLRDDLTREQTRQRVKNHRDKKRDRDCNMDRNNGGNVVCNASETVQKIEVRRKKEERGEGNGAVAPAVPRLDRSDDVVKAWNELGRPFARVVVLSDNRGRALVARLRDPWWQAHWREALAKVPKSGFLAGTTGRGNWRADIDFFIRPDSVAKILEGKYDDPAPESATNGQPGTPVSLSAEEQDAVWAEKLKQQKAGAQ